MRPNICFRYRTNRNGSVTVLASKSTALPDGCYQTINWKPGDAAANLAKAKEFVAGVERRLLTDKN
jgi:hypothetical protein